VFFGAFRGFKGYSSVKSFDGSRLGFVLEKLKKTKQYKGVQKAAGRHSNCSIKRYDARFFESFWKALSSPPKASAASMGRK
jgi:hypothetical protein